MADMNVAKTVYLTILKRKPADIVFLATFEACIVESGMENLSYGDLDSLGVLQQRPSWGSKESRMNVEDSVNRFLDQAIPLSYTWNNSAGMLAYKIQKCAYRYRLRYDNAESKARSLLKQISGVTSNWSGISISSITGDETETENAINQASNSLFDKLIQPINDLLNKVLNTGSLIFIYMLIFVLIIISFNAVYKIDAVKQVKKVVA